MYAIHIENEDRIYPNIRVAGIDVSGLTRQQALQALGVTKYEERCVTSGVTIIFPDESELIIHGNDVGLWHNAHEMVDMAYSIGRGNGTIEDLFAYFQRYDAQEVAFNYEFDLDTEVLFNIVSSFTDEFNRRFELSTPVINENYIVFTKGAGHVYADEYEVFELAYVGLFSSFLNDDPVVITYLLPEFRKFAQCVMDLREHLFVEMQTSVFDPDTISATECAIGVDFDFIEAAMLISDLKTGQSVNFPLEFTHPLYTQEHLESLLFRDLIGERTTIAQGTQNRLNNIRLSSEAIDGLILLPDEEFSFNEVVGQRTTERGYRSAPIIVAGEFVPGIGGGICQTSSTIFAAIKPSELIVTEQYRHGRRVTYLPRGWDAAVSWGHLDFKFINNTDYPIRIDVRLEDRDVIVQVWGTIIDDFPIAADWNIASDLDNPD
jgi:hypothetical protein